MYEAFYGFDRPPFTNIPDPEFLFLSPQHKQALSILRYALMARVGFCVITGDVGAGKTTLVRHVLRSLDPNIHVGLVSNTQCDSFEELLRWILLAFDLEYRGKDKVEMYDEFVQFLITQFNAGCPVTLIIDEAQHLGKEHLEQLRMLSNVNTERGQILQTILVGQPELWDLLHDPSLQQFTQRISYDYFLRPLEDPNLIRQYVEYRQQGAGRSETLFDDDVYPLIWNATRGVPRLINLLCDTALVYGYGQEAARIPRSLIAKVIEDKSSSFAALGARDTGGRPQRPRTGAARTSRLSTIERAALRQRGEG